MARADRDLLKDRVMRRLKSGPLKAQAIKELTGSSIQTVRNCLNRLKKAGVVENISISTGEVSERGHLWRLVENRKDAGS